MAAAVPSAPGLAREYPEEYASEYNFLLNVRQYSLSQYKKTKEEAADAQTVAAACEKFNLAIYHLRDAMERERKMQDLAYMSGFADDGDEARRDLAELETKEQEDLVIYRRFCGGEPFEPQF